MVSWVPQIVVPPLFALAFLRTLPRRWVIALAPTIFLSDLDYLVPGEHRVWTHALVWPALALAAVAWLRKRDGARLGFWAFAARPGWPAGLAIVAFYLAAHAVMDVFTGGVVLFWPLSARNFYVEYQVVLDTATNTLTPQAETGAPVGPFPVQEQYPWLTYEHSAILGFLLACGLVALAFALGRRSRGSTAAPPAPPAAPGAPPASPPPHAPPAPPPPEAPRPPAPPR